MLEIEMSLLGEVDQAAWGSDHHLNAALK